MKNHRFPLALCLLMIAALFSACSLSKDVFQMEEPDDYSAYIEKWAPSEDAFISVQRLAKPSIDAKDWDAAVAVFEKYRSRFPGMQSRFDQIVAVLRAPTFDVKLANLGNNINTRFDEIKPSVTVDGSRMYFASDKEGGKGKLDIYVSEYKDGEWQQAVNLGDRINTPDHETINGISFDGTKILIYGGFPGHMGNGDNYYFEKTDRGWSNIMHFPPMVNSKFYDSDAFMTADGFAVIFTSDREGVVGQRVAKNTRFHGSVAGNTDLFVTVRRGTYWQPPINLGPVINTPYAERSPFLHPDGRTLYFASDGHPGLGKMDVFKSVRPNTNSWTEWSEPVNLGKDVNGSDDDWGYRITPDGKYAFFSTSNQPDGRGENDIYMITLPRGARPEAEVATIKGKILDEDGNPVKDVVVQVQDLNDGKIVATFQTDPQTGEYMGTVPEGGNYAVFAEREGYYPDASPLPMSGGNSDGTGDGSGKDGTGDGSGKDGAGDGSGKDGTGDGSGKDGAGDGSGKDGAGDGSGKNGAGDSSGKDGAGDGSGKDGAGDGSGKDGTGDGSGKDGAGDGSGKDGTGDGSGKDGTGDGSGKNGAGDGSGKNGAGDGSGRDGRDGSGDGDGTRNFTVDFNLKSVENMKNRRDKWGDLLAQRVNSIFFDFDRWDLKPESFYELQRLMRFLESNPEIRIVIAAHTDDKGTDEYNIDLSNKRARAVVDYLVSSGTKKSRLESRGYGESRPEVPNDTDENRARNRRVEFRLAE
jgi:outer membrane protein OmpA-like peptidoglycan-associated protein